MAYEKVENYKSIQPKQSAQPNLHIAAKENNANDDAFLEYFKQLNCGDPLTIQPAPKLPIEGSFRKERYLTTKVTYNSKIGERHASLYNCRFNIASKQERLDGLMWPLAIYLGMANFFSHMKGAHFVSKRYHMLSALKMRLAGLNDVIDNCLKMLRSPLTISFIAKTLMVPIHGFFSDSSELPGSSSSATLPEPKETVSEEVQTPVEDESSVESGASDASEGNLDSPIGESPLPETHDSKESESGAINESETEAEAGNVYDKEDHAGRDEHEERLTGKVGHFIQHSDKAFSGLENTIRSQFQLILKRDEIFMKLESIESRMASKPNSHKVLEAVRRVYKAIDMIDKMLDESDPQLDAMADHIVGGLFGGIALAGLDVDISTDPLSCISDNDLDDILKQAKKLDESQDKNLEELEKDLGWADEKSDHTDQFHDKNMLGMQKFQSNILPDKDTIRPFNISLGMSPVGQPFQGNVFKAGCVNL